MLGIKWIRNIKGFPYKWEGVKRKYIPDFYLPELDLYVEVKGWKREKDEVKWRDFPHKLKIIDEGRMKSLNLLNT